MVDAMSDVNLSATIVAAHVGMLHNNEIRTPSRPATACQFLLVKLLTASSTSWVAMAATG